MSEVSLSPIAERLYDLATEHGDLPAIAIDESMTLTFAAWWDSATRVAKRLEACGIGPGSRIHLDVADDAWTEYVPLLLGCLVARCTAIVVPRSRWSVLTADAVAALGSAGVLSADCARDGALQPRFARGKANCDGTPSGGTDAADELATILLTSGTSGRLRAVGISQANLIHSMSLQASPVGVRASMLYAVSVGTHLAQVVALRGLAEDAPLIRVDTRFTPSGFAKRILTVPPSDVTLMPAQARSLCRYLNGQADLVRGVERVSITGDSSSPQLLAQVQRCFPEAEVRNFYTSTEAYPAAISTTYNGLHPLALGTPNAQRVELRVVPEARTEQAGGIGRIWLRAVGAPPRVVFEPPDWTRQELPNGWVDTGDVGFLRNGSLHLIDRASELVSVGGERVGTRETENALLALPGVADAAAFGVRTATGSEFLAAAVVVESSQSAQDLRVALEGVLPPSAIPRRITLMSFIPRNLAGKVLKVELREMVASTEDIDVPSSTKSAQALLEVIQPLFVGRAELSIAGDLILAGADSLDLLEVCTVVEAHFGVEIDIEEIIQDPRIVGIAALLDQRLAAS